MRLFKVLGLTVALWMFLAVPVKADQLKTAKDAMGDGRPNPTSTTHAFSFTHVTGADLLQINFLFCKEPSGTCDTPTNLTTTGATEGTVSGLVAANWSVTNATNGNLIFYANAGAETVSANTPMTITFGSVVNPSIGGCHASAAGTSADTCYVRITSYTDAGSTASDIGIVSFTVISAVQVQARVDPTFTFVVSPLNSGTVTNQITSSVTTTFSTIPFGNLTAQTPKYGTHALYVTTNTQSGYTVSAIMATQMAGVYTSNNIDPFMATWGSPTTWTEPTGGTPNDNTAWFGANTTDTAVSGWGTPNGMFGGIGSAGAVTVSTHATSDNGVTPTYVTYAIEANVFQPADTYTGTIMYNALPTY